MKKHASLVAVILCSMAAGFLAGKLGTGSGASSHEGKRPTSGEVENVGPRSRESRRTVGPAAGSAGRKRGEIRAASAKQAPSMVFMALEQGDPVLRHQMLADLMAKMTPENFAEMLSEMERVSNETGREHREDWIMMNVCAGQVAGEAIMEYWRGKNARSPTAAQAFYGWACTDPAAAMRWMESRPSEYEASGEALQQSLVSGALVHDPDDATRMFNGWPEEERRKAMKSFTSGLVENVGKDGAIDWLVSVQKSEGATEYSRQAETVVFDRLLWSGANRTNATSMAGDLELLSKVMPITEDWIVRGMGQIRDRKLIGGIELLDQISRNPTLKDLPLGDRAWSSAVEFAVKRNRGAVDEWLAANPDSPIHGQVRDWAAR